MDECAPLGNVFGSDMVNMTRLLSDTHAREWQAALKKLLTSYYQHDVMKHAVIFLADNIYRAIEALRSPDLYPGFPAIYIHTEKKPIIFDIDLWKDILIALNFEITEPEGNRHLDLIEVKVTSRTKMSSLHGFISLLKHISELTWESVRLVLYMQGNNEEMQLLHTLQHLSRNGDPPPDQGLVRSLYERQTSAMEGLGFQKRRGTTRGSKPEIPWEGDSSRQIEHVQVVLLGLFHDGEGLETYI